VESGSLPLIFAGGPTATSNPEPFADFFDYFLLGDGAARAVDIWIDSITLIHPSRRFGGGRSVRRRVFVVCGRQGEMGPRSMLLSLQLALFATR
jgi:hypothetical protein